MLRNLFIVILLFALSACSLQFDSQYGIRFEPAKIEADASRPQPYSADQWASPMHPYSAPETAPEVSIAPAETPAEANYFVNEEQVAPAPALVPSTESEATDPVPAVEAEQTIAATAAWPKKKPERNMTVAWVLWAIPAVLVLFAAGGLLLNFGAHWYYLGYRRKGMAKTIIWALTLAVSTIALFFANVLGMNLLAALIALIVLLPLAVIQIVGLVKDFFALQKIANKKARGRKQRIV